MPEYQKGLFESHEIFQHAGERAERVLLHQIFLAAQYLSRVNKRMKRMRTIFENLQTEIGRIFSRDPQLFNDQCRRENLSEEKMRSSYIWLLTCLQFLSWSSRCAARSAAPCCSSISATFQLLKQNWDHQSWSEQMEHLWNLPRGVVMLVLWAGCW